MRAAMGKYTQACSNAEDYAYGTNAEGEETAEECYDEWDGKYEDTDCVHDDPPLDGMHRQGVHAEEGSQQGYSAEGVTKCMKQDAE